MFETINSENQPEVLLRIPFAYFRIWNYSDAIPYLQKFLKREDTAPYRKLIGKVNLAAAYLNDRKYELAEHLLTEIKLECEANNYLLLLGNCFELLAQVQFFNNNFQQSLHFLNRSKELLKNQGGEFLLFTEKWTLLCEAFLKKDDVSLSNLRTFKQKAFNQGQWETVRECDLFEAALTKNEKLIRQVIMGTPFERYRQRARKLLGQNVFPQGHLHWYLTEATEGQETFLFNSYEIQAGQESLHTKPQLLALFQAMTLDFYKPNNIGFLFQKIYPTEKFNPFSSPKRVLSLIHRLNDWFEQQQVPLRIKLKKSEFALTAFNEQGDKSKVAVAILVQRATPVTKQHGQLFYLKQFFKDRTFSAQSVSEKMNISKTSAQSLIAEAIQHGHVIKNGNGRGTTYLLAGRRKKEREAA